MDKEVISRDPLTSTNPSEDNSDRTFNSFYGTLENSLSLGRTGSLAGTIYQTPFPLTCEGKLSLIWRLRSIATYD